MGLEEVCPISHPNANSPDVFNTWDCARLGNYKGWLDDGYYINAKFAIVMFDITKEGTYAKVLTYVRDVKRVCEGIPIAIFANKIDLKADTTHEHCIILQDNIRMYQTSVKMGYNLRTPLD